MAAAVLTTEDGAFYKHHGFNHNAIKNSVAANLAAFRARGGRVCLDDFARGVVTGIDAEPGMVVAAGTPVVRVANDGPRDIVSSVSEDQVALVRAAAARPSVKLRFQRDWRKTRLRSIVSASTIGLMAS